MFDHLTDRARKVMFFARREAQRFNHDFIGTEHILLGIIKEADGVGFQILTNLGIDLDALVKNIEGRITVGPSVVLRQIPFTSRAKKALEFASEFAGRKGNTHIGTESLFYGLACESTDGSESIACRALAELGATPQAVEESVDELLCARKAYEKNENE